MSEKIKSMVVPGGAHLFDTHAHLGLESYYDEDREAVITRAREVGVGEIATVGIDLEESQKAVEIARAHEGIYAIIGVHPHEAKTLSARVLKKLEALATEKKVVAYGEIGLDFFRNLSPKDIQLRAFREQIQVAKHLGLPIVIHDREAHEDTLRVLKEEKTRDIGGILHCFSGDVRMAWECIAMGFLISIPGTVTFKKAKTIQAVTREIPLDYLVVETDCPFLTPTPFRGKRNEPAYVQYTAGKVAELKGLSPDEIARVTTENARRLFRLKE